MTPSMRKPDLTPVERNKIFQVILANSSNGKAAKGVIQNLASLYGVSVRTIQSTWRAAQNKVGMDRAMVFKSNKKGAPRNKRVFLDEAAFLNLKPEHTFSIRQISKELGISKTTVHRMKKQGLLVAQTNAIKPSLTDANKLERMHYVLSNIYYDHEEQCFKFKPMFDVIHFDEKWFYMQIPVKRHYTLPNQPITLRTCRSKRYIGKVIFLCGVGRPHSYNPSAPSSFDGKIGNWPLVEWVDAKRKNINRDKGTPELKAIPGIDKEITKKFLLEKVIPAIKEKWPDGASKNVIIQWDNATPHIKNSDPDIRAACFADGFNIQLYCQPPNSPDCNINDIGWFRCIETVQWETRTYNVESLCEIVQEAFDSVSPEKLNKVFLSKQMIMTEILKDKGGNGFKQPHMSKDMLIRAGTLPISLVVDEELIRESLDYVLDH